MNNSNPYTDKLNKWSSHSRIVSMLEELPKGARILDVGTASGTVARLCVVKDYYLRGIEPNPIGMEDSQNLYSDFYSGSLEQTPDSFLENNDAVVFGDVLEHLVNPEEQLKRVVKTQSGDCLFVISVPNIANLWIRLSLLFGQFEYEDRGILDRTHLHFYTRKTFSNLLIKAGLNIDEIHTTPIPLELVNTFFAENPIGKAMYSILAQVTKWWPTLLGYQFVARAHK